METRVLDWNPDTGVTQLFHYDHLTDQFHIENVYDAEPILDQNKDLTSLVGPDAKWKGDMHRVAQIPMTIYMDLMKKGITKDPKAFKKWLNDPANRYFRTRGGKV
jgi:hypothetical protein